MQEIIGKQDLPNPKEIWREILMCIILHDSTPGNGDYARLPSLTTAHRERKDLLLETHRRMRKNSKPGLGVDVY